MIATATVDGRPLVNADLIRWHLVASAVFFAVSLLGGLAYAFQFNNLYPFAGIEWLSPGRVRMVHTNMAAYGFIANAFIARHAVRDPASDPAPDPVGSAGLAHLRRLAAHPGAHDRGSARRATARGSSGARRRSSSTRSSSSGWCCSS